MSALEIIAYYVLGFCVVQVVWHLFLRSEPTAHGQIVGTQIGCLVGLAWPLSVPYFLLAAIGVAIVEGWKRFRSLFK